MINFVNCIFLFIIFTFICGCRHYDGDYFRSHNTIDKSWKPSANYGDKKFTIINGFTHMGGGVCHPIIIIGHAFFVIPMEVIRGEPELTDCSKTEFDMDEHQVATRERLCSTGFGPRSVAIDLDQEYAYIMYLGYEFKISKIDGRISWLDYDENANIYISKVVFIRKTN